MRKVSEMYKMYRELPIFQVSSLLMQTKSFTQALFDALEELCDEEDHDPGGENPTLPLQLAPVVVHTFDRVST